MRRLSTLTLAALLLGAAPIALAQEAPIYEETLGAATAFDAGALSTQDISLPSSLWQGTSAKRAAGLIRNAPAASDNPLIRDMVRAALLSPGVPPEGNRDQFEAARLAAVMRLGDQRALDTFLSRNPALGQTPEARVNIALSQGDSQAACAVSDSITTDRSAPTWARLRAVCHVLRDEISAAELTRDLLQSGGLDDAAYFALLSNMMGSKRSAPTAAPSDDALISFMRARISDAPKPSDAMNLELSAEDRLKAVWANLAAYSDAELSGIMSDLAFDPDDIAGSSSFDLASATANTQPQGTAQIYLLAKSGNASAFAELAKRAGGASDDLVRIMSNVIATMPASDQAQANLPLFARAAVERRDIATLQGLYRAVDTADAQSRIALAADALGGGFRARPMGTDIETRLGLDGDAVVRAKRDTALALALGATMSDVARDALSGQALSGGRNISVGDLIILRSAAEVGASAEVVLLSARHIKGRELNAASLSEIIRALRQVGQSEFAGQIAATDFIRPL
ncbi:hypothetical protein ACJ3XI_11835 [Litorimonas sp. RW-G-Af-16]|uniref:hypothetical protein n=1 Tax=Litorimonas sp. RW-G-Af-16 TaxID=3241168 RepID=UPI00390C64E5